MSRQDQLLPLFVLETAGHIPGLSGLFVAGVFSAALRYKNKDTVTYNKIDYLIIITKKSNKYIFETQIQNVQTIFYI